MNESSPNLVYSHQNIKLIPDMFKWKRGKYIQFNIFLNQIRHSNDDTIKKEDNKNCPKILRLKKSKTKINGMWLHEFSQTIL